MEIVINLSDGLPIYRQIANQIRYLVASGQLEPGEEIPSIRSLALRLKVTPNTVVKAYQELESAGVLEKRAGAGTYVKGDPTPLAKQERRRIIEQRIDGLLAEGHQLGFAADELLDAFRRRQSVMEAESNEEDKGDRKLG
jgi:GntR family transcriptional regulator